MITLALPLNCITNSASMLITLPDLLRKGKGTNGLASWCSPYCSTSGSVSLTTAVNTQAEPVLKETLLPGDSQPVVLATAEHSQPMFNSHFSFQKGSWMMDYIYKGHSSIL